MMERLFTDGGCLGHNPSTEGITWAWVLVGKVEGSPEAEEIIQFDTGIITTPDYAYGGRFTNNVAELEAAVRALLWLSEHRTDWRGELCSDSAVTLGRLFQRWKLSGIPDSLYRRMGIALRQNGYARNSIHGVLLQGHPTKRDLDAGIGKARSLPVSRWNVYVDRLCKELARDWQRAKFEETRAAEEELEKEALGAW